MALDFIRYFAVTNDSPIGKVAQSYLLSLLRIAPVRVVSKSGQLEGSWQRFTELILTPMAGMCVSCVCTPPAAWTWEQSVPMPEKNLGADGAARADAPAVKVAGVARGVLELYTPPGKTVLRNVLFMAEAPKTDAQHKTASRYEAVIAANLDICAAVAVAYPTFRFEAAVVPVFAGKYQISPEGHQRIREAVTGCDPDGVYR